MSIERSLIARARPHIISSRLRDIILPEICKGCLPEISPVPVALEPIFQPIWTIKDSPSVQNETHWTIESPILKKDISRLQVWISPEQMFDWVRSERFIKQLQTVTHRVGFEVVGNNKGIKIYLLCHKMDIPIIMAAFKGEFEFCEITLADQKTIDKAPHWKTSDIILRDYFPPPPYSHLLTRPQELHLSPLTPLITSMSAIESPATGLYQVLFQPVHPAHNWHRNVEFLLDYEYTIKLQDGFHPLQRYAQQSPSGDLRQMSFEVESKANNDKAFFAMALRTAVIGGGEKKYNLIASLSAFSSLFQHGGRPLGYLTDKDYSKIFLPHQNSKMFLIGLTYRTGFLVNSLELTGAVHVPPLNSVVPNPAPMEGLVRLPVRNPEIFSGTWIGTCSHAGIRQKVCLPLYIRKKHTHLVGASGTGKSTAEENMIMEDISVGDGVAVLDPHGDMIDRLLCLIPEKYVGRTIFFDPGDPDWVPIWNPLKRVPGQDIGQTANDLVEAIKSFVAVGGWGDRLANILRNMIFSMLCLSDGTFLDIFTLLRNKSKKNERIVQEIMKIVDNEAVREFWKHDYKGYGKNDLSPPINKLSKLLVSGTVSLMLSQPENRFDFRKIMDEQKILLIDLSKIGKATRQVLGCFILSILHLNALSRRDTPTEKRKQFHIYCDEAYNFLTDSIEEFLVETRKYGVSLNLAHQYLSQFSKKKMDALSTVSAAVVFRVDKRDADYLAKDLQGKVKPADILSLPDREAFARIGTDVVKIDTRPPLIIPENHFRDRIIEDSHKQYYRPALEVKKWIRSRGDRWNPSFTSLTNSQHEGQTGRPGEFIYDQF